MWVGVGGRDLRTGGMYGSAVSLDRVHTARTPSMCCTSSPCLVLRRVSPHLGSSRGELDRNAWVAEGAISQQAGDLVMGRPELQLHSMPEGGGKGSCGLAA